MIKSGLDAYMVIGILTLCKSLTGTDGLEDSAQKVGLASGARTGPLSFTSGEIIVAVQYRKVMLQWFWSRDVGTVLLETGSNRWEPLVNTKMTEPVDSDGEDIVEAKLQDAIVAEDVAKEGDVYTVSDQVIVL